MIHIVLIFIDFWVYFLESLFLLDVTLSGDLWSYNPSDGLLLVMLFIVLGNLYKERSSGD